MKFCINSHNIISFIFIICLLISGLSFSDNASSSIKNDTFSTQITQQTISEIAGNKQPPREKKILTGNRDLGWFFTIGLIINLAMMTTFAIWAIGQWRQNNDKNKK